MKKPIVIIFCVAATVVLWFIAAHYFGPDSQHGIAKEIERFQQDSIALQGNFSPIGSDYAYYQDIDKAVSDIRDLGDPLRFGRTEIDSTRLFSTPQTAAIANYNIAKCDSVLNEVLPQWRRTLAFTLQKQLNKEAQTIIRMSKEYENSTGIEIYSLRYLSKDNIESDARKLNSVFHNLGFKSVVYATSPNNEGIEYTFND